MPHQHIGAVVAEAAGQILQQIIDAIAIMLLLLDAVLFPQIFCPQQPLLGGKRQRSDTEFAVGGVQPDDTALIG